MKDFRAEDFVWMIPRKANWWVIVVVFIDIFTLLENIEINSSPIFKSTSISKKRKGPENLLVEEDI